MICLSSSLYLTLFGWWYDIISIHVSFSWEINVSSLHLHLCPVSSCAIYPCYFLISSYLILSYLISYYLILSYLILSPSHHFTLYDGQHFVFSSLLSLFSLPHLILFFFPFFFSPLLFSFFFFFSPPPFPPSSSPSSSPSSFSPPPRSPLLLLLLLLLLSGYMATLFNAVGIEVMEIHSRKSQVRGQRRENWCSIEKQKEKNIWR